MLKTQTQTAAIGKERVSDKCVEQGGWRRGEVQQAWTALSHADSHGSSAVVPHRSRLHERAVPRRASVLGAMHARTGFRGALLRLADSAAPVRVRRLQRGQQSQSFQQVASPHQQPRYGNSSGTRTSLTVHTHTQKYEQTNRRTCTHTHLAVDSVEEEHASGVEHRLPCCTAVSRLIIPQPRQHPFTSQSMHYRMARALKSAPWRSEP
jgi:hypothetical protein